MPLRNPFLLRAAEQMDSDAAFLRLFSPGVLDVIPHTETWDRVRVLRSAPGGGKTSLLKLLTPSALLTLHASGSNDETKDLYQRMQALGAIDESGPKVLGVMLSCARKFAPLEDTSAAEGRGLRLFFALLDAKLVLAGLRGALLLRRLRYPDDLPRLRIRASIDADLPASLPAHATGADLYEWAKTLERKIGNAIDSFATTIQDVTEGHDTLYSTALLAPGALLCDDAIVAPHSLLMLDDVNQLTPKQRRALFSTLVETRPRMGTWLAERLEALSADELLGQGAVIGREYDVVNLEDHWRSNRNRKKFERAVVNIADRRVRLATDVEITSFADCLQDSLVGPEWDQFFRRALGAIQSSVRQTAKGSKIYERWVDAERANSSLARDQAYKWRQLLILIERDRSKAQTDLDLGMSPLVQGAHRDDASYRAAEFFVARDFKAPYYFGMARLAYLASSNIEQFLGLSSELFELMSSSSLLRRDPVLDARTQEQTLRRAVERRWEEIPTVVPYGRDVQRLLEGIHQVARHETDRPSAPYAPGVTGIGFSMADREELIHTSATNGQPSPYGRLVRALAAAIAHNLLEPLLDQQQGRPGDSWMVLYLNRWLCLRFSLPLSYGGWRKQKLSTLRGWLDHAQTNLALTTHE